MKMLGISGSMTSTGRTGKTRAAIEFTMNAAKSKFPDLEIAMLDLRDFKVAMLDGRALADYKDDTPRVVAMMESADCFVIGTPVYRGTYTGALKNLIDHAPYKAFMGKVVGFIVTAASSHHYLSIDHEMRAVMAWFNPYMAPGSAYLENSHWKGDDIVDERIQRHLAQLGENVVLMTQKLKGVEALPPPLIAW
jgi:FAD reductase [NAD(P)H]